MTLLAVWALLQHPPGVSRRVFLRRASHASDTEDVVLESLRRYAKAPTGSAQEVLAFLGAGYTPCSKDTHDGINFGDVVRAGIMGLIQTADGDPVRALALCEAYRLTESRKFKGPAEEAIADGLARMNDGGWGAIETTARWVQALRSAQLAGLPVPDEALASVRRHVERLRVPDPEPIDLTPLIRDLGSESYDEREAAADALMVLGPPAIGAVRKAMRSGDPEVAERARRLERILRTEATTAAQILCARLHLGLPPGDFPQTVLDATEDSPPSDTAFWCWAATALHMYGWDGPAWEKAAPRIKASLGDLRDPTATVAHEICRYYGSVFGTNP